MPYCEETECYTYAVIYHPPFWTDIIYSPFVDENGVKYETEDATKVPLGKYTKYFKATAFSCNGCNSIKNNSFFLELVRTTIITQPSNNRTLIIEPSHGTFSWKFIIYIICTLLILQLGAVIVFIIIKRKGSNQKKLSIAIIFTKQSHAKNSPLKLITIKELIMDMDDKNKIGAGEFGTVYAAKLIIRECNNKKFPVAVKAMEYLSSYKIIHRDLAARNVLMKKYHHVEVTDFGLAAILREESQALQKLPFRWVPLECLREPTNMKLYCEASDVWSFGVTCWEILTFAQMPYCDLNFMFMNALKTLYGFLNDGGRLGQPKICSLELYQNLLMCWAANPLSRPTFTSLRETFEHHAKQPYMYITDARNIQETLDFTLDNEDKQLELIKNVLGEDDYLEPREQDDIYNYLKNDSITQSDGGENLYIQPIDEKI
uniref:receptor protein-tyrosine kinase n=1 Tax=Acrobeloides nanus TaxID=290746 RepID=A0A914DTT2_9BILA